jgi:3-oxoacyl-[acyl-carrier protein] reductase
MATVNNILITGSNGGIGFATAELFAKKGKNLILLYHEKNNKIEELQKKYSKIEIFKTDLSNLEKLDITLDNVLKDYHVDTFVHSPAYSTEHNDIMKLSWEKFQKQIDLHVKSFFNISRHVLPEMKTNSFGKIVSVLTSYVIGKPPNLLSDYIVAKYALLGMTKSMSVELGRFGINVNSISPSMVNTPLTEHLPNKLKEITKSQTPLENRLAEPIDVARVIEFLCSENASYITGENIIVSGGSTIH